MTPSAHRATRRPVPDLAVPLAAAWLSLLPMLAWADSYGKTDRKLCGFLNNITGLLDLGSMAVVTIAIVFAGYQIAFNHKRITEVASILVGGLFTGAAAQIAKMVVGGEGNGCEGLGALIQGWVTYAA